MAASDAYFRFPLSCLAYGHSAHIALRWIISYSVVSAGIGASMKPEAYAAILSEETLPDPPNNGEDTLHYDYVRAGAHLTNIRPDSWRNMYARYEELHQHTLLFPKSALVTMKAKWVWNALDTAWLETNEAPFNESHGWMTWREFRVLAAVLSVIGTKSFAWVSTATLLHRTCGYTAAASMKGKPPSEACPPLTRWMLENTLKRLEELRFFLRVRISRSPTGRGGKTAYSIRHATRESLIKEIRVSGFAKAESNRKADYALWTKQAPL